MRLLEEEFLQDVSHELKTPLFSAQGFVHTLLDNINTDKEIREKFLKKAAKSLDYLDLLVRDLLTISQMETGEIKMKMEAFDIVSLIEETVEQIEPIALSKKIDVSVVKKDWKSIVLADYYRIFQVLKNLLSNAIKYSEDNSTIEIQIEKEKKLLTLVS